MKSPKVTPPVLLVVQRVIGPPEVPNNLGLAALAPSFEVIRPADFTRIPPLPAEMLAFNEVVAVPRASKETLFSAVVVAPIVMFPPEEREMLVLAVRAAEVVMAPADEVIDIAPAEEFIAAVVFTPAQVTERSPATLSAPLELVNSPDPPQFIVSELPAVELLTAAETVMAPALSI